MGTAETGKLNMEIRSCLPKGEITDSRLRRRPVVIFDFGLCWFRLLGLSMISDHFYGLDSQSFYVKTCVLSVLS